MNESGMSAWPRVQLAHATAQVIAEDIGSRVLHIKGPALDPSLLHRLDGDVKPRGSSDADLLVEPGRVGDLVEALTRHRFRLVTHFETGSAFEHAASLWHEKLGWVDVHRRFPGIGMPAAEAFDRLWAHRQQIRIAGYPCAAPSRLAQRLMLLLHAARGGGVHTADVARAWGDATTDERRAVSVLARELAAEVGLAAATGGLDAYADHPEYELWRHFSTGERSRIGEWRARLKAAPDARTALKLASRAVRVNTDALAMKLHRRPTRSEVVREFGHRLWTSVNEIAHRARRGRP
ncbi:MAG: nucleotidyltransferase family protein [Propionibacteriaceae bacterium]|nr:nucleotidyltransferase family protein [Propionibacteriaceae bacterium]